MPVAPFRHLMTALLLGGGTMGLVGTISLVAGAQAAPSTQRRRPPCRSWPRSNRSTRAPHAYQAVPGLADLLTRLHPAHPEHLSSSTTAIRSRRVLSRSGPTPSRCAD